MTISNHKIEALLAEIARCQVCSDLPLGVNPVLRIKASALLLIVGQAPGTRVHKTGIPWNDPSGDELRRWLQIDKEQFYHDPRIAIVPMGFCYPGKGKSGDLPPRPQCAPTWHTKVLEQMPNLKLKLLVGSYAQKYYLNTNNSLTNNVLLWDSFISQGCFPLPHPSPRNRLWQKRNPWFEQDVLPELRKQISWL